MSSRYALILTSCDNLVINNYWRKYQTYLEIGWDSDSIHKYLLQKDKIMQVASFNTPIVSFSASSRRNRFYEIYNRPDMLEKDVAYEGCIEALTQLSEKYEIYIISPRNDALKEKTLEIMSRLGFYMDKIHIFFKEANAILHNYRKDCILQIKEKHATGVAICLNPDEGTIFEAFNYTPVGFTSLKNPEEFNGKIKVVFQNWNQILNSLKNT